MRTEPTQRQREAAHLAYGLTDRELAHRVTLAACASSDVCDEERAALSLEAAARLRALSSSAASHYGRTFPAWMVRYDEARRLELEHQAAEVSS